MQKRTLGMRVGYPRERKWVLPIPVGDEVRARVINIWRLVNFLLK